MPGQQRSLFLLLSAGVLLAVLYFVSEPTAGTTATDAQATDAQQVHGDATAPESAPGAVIAAADQAPVPAAETLTELRGEGYRAQISSHHGGVARLTLTEARYVDDEGQPMQLVTTDRPEYQPFQFELGGDVEPTEQPWEVRSLSNQGLALRQRVGSLDVTRKLEPGEGPYQIWITTTVRNRGERPVRIEPQASTYHYVAREDEGGGFLAVRSPAISHGLCNVAGENERIDREDLLETHTFTGAIDFTGIETTYFLNALASHEPTATSCELQADDRGGTPKSPHGSLLTAHLRYPEHTLQPGEQTLYRTLAYMGPKMPAALHQAGHELHQAIDLGFFASLSQGLTWLLRSIHEMVGNWGVAIVLLTLLVKLVLYPLTEKSFRSMAEMQKLKPEMDRINELYKDDREKKGAAIMELYRKHKINPMGGCLPQLLQLPIWFALYTSLSTNVELFRAPFALWWTDLSRPDPYFVLPLALGLLMFLQQKLTPTAMDPAQAKVMMYVMPIMITSFMLFLPAGLGLYMFTNSALSIGQQRLVQRRVGAVAPGGAAKSLDTGGPGGDGGGAPASDSTDDVAGTDTDSMPPTSSHPRLRKTKPRKTTPRRSRRG